jgi:hypothetical protein
LRCVHIDKLKAFLLEAIMKIIGILCALVIVMLLYLRIHVEGGQASEEEQTLFLLAKMTDAVWVDSNCMITPQSPGILSLQREEAFVKQGIQDIQTIHLPELPGFQRAVFQFVQTHQRQLETALQFAQKNQHLPADSSSASHFRCNMIRTSLADMKPAWQGLCAYLEAPEPKIAEKIQQVHKQDSCSTNNRECQIQTQSLARLSILMRGCQHLQKEKSVPVSTHDFQIINYREEALTYFRFLTWSILP